MQCPTFAMLVIFDMPHFSRLLVTSMSETKYVGQKMSPISIFSHQPPQIVTNFRSPTALSPVQDSKWTKSIEVLPFLIRFE